MRKGLIDCFLPVDAVHCGIAWQALLKIRENMAVYGSGGIAVEAGLSGQRCAKFRAKIWVSQCRRCILTAVDADEYHIVRGVVVEFGGNLVALWAIDTVNAIVDFKYGIFVLRQGADRRSLGE